MSSIASSSRSVLRSLPRSTGYGVRQASRPISLPVRSSITPLSLSQSRSFFSLNDISKLASSLTGSDTDSGDGTQSRGVESDGEFQKFHARKILPYSQAQLYSLVSDVPSYSSFIPFCNSSRVLAGKPGSISGGDKDRNGDRRTVDWSPDDQPFDLEAELMVGFGGLEEVYTSRVVGKPFESVTATAAKQSPLFKSLKTTWSFSPASPLSPHASISPPSSDATPKPNLVEDSSPRDGPTLLTIDLAFSFANPLHRIASQAVLPKVADKMVEAFEQRCVEVYGRGSA